MPRTKAVIRNLPPDLPETSFREAVDAAGFAGRYGWFDYVPGKVKPKLVIPSVAYVQFADEPALFAFGAAFNGRGFTHGRPRPTARTLLRPPSNPRRSIAPQWSTLRGRRPRGRDLGAIDERALSSAIPNTSPSSRERRGRPYQVPSARRPSRQARVRTRGRGARERRTGAREDVRARRRGEASEEASHIQPRQGHRRRSRHRRDEIQVQAPQPTRAESLRERTAPRAGNEHRIRAPRTSRRAEKAAGRARRVRRRENRRRRSRRRPRPARRSSRAARKFGRRPFQPPRRRNRPRRSFRDRTVASQLGTRAGLRRHPRRHPRRGWRRRAPKGGVGKFSFPRRLKTAVEVRKRQGRRSRGRREGF